MQNLTSEIVEQATQMNIQLNNNTIELAEMAITWEFKGYHYGNIEAPCCYADSVSIEDVLQCIENDMDSYQLEKNLTTHLNAINEENDIFFYTDEEIQTRISEQERKHEEESKENNFKEQFKMMQSIASFDSLKEAEKFYNEVHKQIENETLWKWAEGVENMSENEVWEHIPHWDKALEFIKQIPTF
jgi:hypothetical protein